MRSLLAGIALLALAGGLPREGRAAPAGDVTVTDVRGLVSAAGSLGPGKTVLLAPGTYVLPHRIVLSQGGSAEAPAVLAAAGSPGSVVVDASGAEEAFLVMGACFVRIEGLTITGGACHAIKVDPPSTDVVLSNNRLYDNTRTKNLDDQVSAIKGDPHAVRVTVEGNTVEQLTAYAGTNFQGIDCNGGTDWIVRGNTVRDIRGAALSGSGIQFKSGSLRTVIENNLVVRCGLNGIVYGGFGNPAWNNQTFEHVGGIVRNNVVVGCADAGITVIKTTDGKVVNNTLFNNGRNPDVRIEARNLEFRNNILDWPIELRDRTSAVKANNLVLPKPSDGSWFVNAAGMDFRPRAGGPVAPEVGASLVRKPARRGASAGAAKAELKLGHDCIGRGEWAKAYRHFESVATEGGDEEAISQARDSMRKIDAESASRLKDAQALEAIGEEADARAAYLEILKEFVGLPAAQEARERIDALKKSPATPGRK